jgi:hypothetical protein
MSELVQEQPNAASDPEIIGLIAYIAITPAMVKNNGG